jgi:cell wall-associated NlpC family hydrolase
LIAWEPAAPVAAEDQGRRGNRGNAGNDGTSNSSGNGSGNQVANFAMQYVGYPYAYAGEGPYAFDCSGFTKFVIQNTLGIDITHAHGGASLAALAKATPLERRQHAQYRRGRAY